MVGGVPDTDALLGLKPLPKGENTPQPPEEKRLWRKFRQVAQLPERDKRALLRIIDSATLATEARRTA